jgi:hypothetical protein
MGSTPSAGGIVGVCTATVSVAAAEVTVERSHTSDRCSLTWSVVHFPRTASATATGALESGPGACNSR